MNLIDKICLILFLLIISISVFYILFITAGEVVITIIVSILGIFSFVLSVYQFFKKE